MLRIRVRKHELGLWFRNGDLVRLLQPGAYFVPGRFVGRDSVEVVSTLETRFEHAKLDTLVLEPALRDEVVLVELDDSERGLVWKDGRLAHVLGPGRYAFWKRPARIDVEVHDVTEPRFEHPKMGAILAHADADAFLWSVHVPPRTRALFFREGRLVETAEAGIHTFWKQVANVTCRLADLRERVVDVAGQEIMTADKVTLRLNVVLTYRVTDAVAAVSVVEDYEQALYREAQLALRAAIGTRTLDKLLADKEALGNEVRDAVAERAGEFGVTVTTIGLRDVILPGEMKTILNQVIEAEKQAEANLIRRREETAAARSQANTARLLADNPVLARMKEIEALQEILRGANATFILGQGDLAEQIRKLAVRMSAGETLK